MDHLFGGMAIHVILDSSQSIVTPRRLVSLLRLKRDGGGSKGCTMNHQVRRFQTSFSNRPIRWLLCAAGTACLIGCAITARSEYSSATSEWPSPRVRSFVRDGERVNLRLITHERWATDYAGLTGADNKPIVLPDQLDAIEPQNALVYRSLPMLDSAIGAAVGVLVDVVKAEIEKEAARHQQQFTQSTYADDFFKGPGRCRYAAFEVERIAKDFGDAAHPESPAFRMICAILPSKHDRRIFLLKPVFLRLNAAAAKVSESSGGATTLSIKVNTVLQGAKVKKDGTLEQPNLADATFTWSGYDLKTRPIMSATFDRQTNTWSGELRDATAGYFLSPTPYPDETTSSDAARDAEKAGAASVALAGAKAELDRLNAADPKDPAATKKAEDAVGAAKKESDAAGAALARSQSRWEVASAGGAFRLYVAVTETDDSKAKEHLLKFAEFVGGQKDELVKQAKAAVTGTDPGTPGK